MKILHISNSTTPAGGGPIESIIQSHIALTPHGHTVEVACMDDPSSAWIGQLPLKTYALGPSYTPYRYAPRYTAWLKANAGNYDCVILHGIWLHASAGAWQVLRHGTLPYFIYSHGLLDPVLGKVFPLKHLKKLVAWRLLENKIVRDARAVFFTCEEERDLASRSFKPFTCNPALVPYCVGEPPGDPDQQRRAFLAAFPDCTNRRICLFIARLHPKKGCDLALHAFKTVVDADPNACLVMAGPDSVGWKRSLAAMTQTLGIAGNVVWTGMLEGDLKWGAFRSADVFILPSHQENFGIAVVEALACGTPALISERVNIWRELSRDGACLSATDSLAGTTDMLMRWWSTPPAQRDNFRFSARACYEARFQSESAAANLLATLRSFGVHG